MFTFSCDIYIPIARVVQQIVYCICYLTFGFLQSQRSSTCTHYTVVPGRRYMIVRQYYSYILQHMQQVFQHVLSNSSNSCFVLLNDNYYIK